MKTFILISLSIVSCFTSHAQSTDSLKRKWKISEATLLLGSTRGGIAQLSMEDYQQIVPESLLLKDAIVSASGSQKPHGFGNTTGASSINVGLTPKSGVGILRLGLLYQGRGATSYYWHETSQTGLFDTLTSSATGETFLIDSTRSETYFADTRMEHVGLDVSMVFNTHYQRLNFFGGLGISGSASLNSKTFISHVAMTEFEQDYATYTLQQNNVVETEIFKLKSTFQGQIYIPMGIDLTLGKKRPIFAHSALHLEFRPSLRFQQLANSRVQASVVSSSFLGLKYRL